MRLIPFEEHKALVSHPKFSWWNADASPDKPWIFDASPYNVAFNFEDNSPRRKDDLDWLCEDLASIFEGFSVAHFRFTEIVLLPGPALALLAAVRRGEELGPLPPTDDIWKDVYVFSPDEADLMWAFFYLAVQIGADFDLSFPEQTAAFGHGGEYYFITWDDEPLFQRVKEAVKDFYPEFPRESA